MRRAHGLVASLGWSAFFIVPLALWACGGDGGPSLVPGPPGTQRPAGAIDFVSAESTASQSRGAYDTDAGAVPEAPGEEERQVEEGDIYRLLGPNLIVNLNYFRGLQIIDATDLENPAVIGRLQVSGDPVELYTVGSRAFLLLNGWRGYAATRYEPEVESQYGGLVLSVDLTDPSAPAEIDRQLIPGTLRTSRLVRQGEEAALYVVSGDYTEVPASGGPEPYPTTWESHTLVQSYDVSEGLLVPRTTLNLGGYVTDIQATPEALLVARNDWTGGDNRSRVSIIDIQSPDGAMIEGDEITVAGWVRNQFAMDLYRGVLRVVSGSTWGSAPSNTLATYDASNIHTLELIDEASFGAGEDLYAALFLGNKAFFVTYRRVDPFHAFRIDDDGRCTEMAQFVVTGWNDFFSPVFTQTRLIGIGVEDTGVQTLAVSLYDISDLGNPEPLLDREVVEADWGWSEASYDHRAYSVLEGAVAVDGPGDVLETGVVLLPFSGYSEDAQTYTSGVQIFSFSERTLTRRGLMLHGTPVRRSFQPVENVTANLSEAELSLFDTADPDAPALLGSVELAPSYTDFFTLGDYRARLHERGEDYFWWWGGRGDQPDSTVEIVARDEHPDWAASAARFDVPAGSSVFQTGDLLVSASTRWVDGSSYSYGYQTELAVWDLSDPLAPVAAGTLTTDRLQPPSYSWYWGPEADMGGMPYWSTPSWGSDVQAVPGGLVFLQRRFEQELLGTEHVCVTYPVEPGSCVADPSAAEACTYYTGWIECRGLAGETPVCSGNMQRCEGNGDGAFGCTEIDPHGVQTTEYCWDSERYRYWQRFDLEVLDATDPMAPELVDTLSLPRDYEGLSMLADGSDLWVSYKVPVEVAGDGRPYARHYALRIDLERPGAPALDEPINVPGELLTRDGNIVYTRDALWGTDFMETGIARLRLVGGVAVLEASRTFPEQVVADLVLDGAGHVLVSHGPAWQTSWGGSAGGGGGTAVDTAPRGAEATTSDTASAAPQVQQLTVLDATSSQLAVLATVPVASWADLRQALAGRALFEVPGGMLVFNLDDPARPYAQAFFPTRGWPSKVMVDGRELLCAAGRFGLYAFDIDRLALPPVEDE